MHLGNVERILEKRVKHSATPRVLHASLVFSQHSPRALSHHKRTRLVLYFLININPFMYYLKHEPQCFIRYKDTRRSQVSLGLTKHICTANVLNYFKNDPSSKFIGEVIFKKYFFKKSSEVSMTYKYTTCL